MERISGDDEHVQATLVFHPDSAALDDHVRAMVRDELKKRGILPDDAYEVYKDMEFLRGLRNAQRATIGWVLKSIGMAVFAGLVGMFVLGVKSWLKQNH